MMLKFPNGRNMLADMNGRMGIGLWYNILIVLYLGELRER